MFVIPPPSAKFYPSVTQELANRSPTVMEINNVLETLAPEEYQLVIGEGTYQLRDSVLIAQPPPHPSESTSQPPNPLDTARKPPTAGTNLSPVILTRKPSPIYKPVKVETPNSGASPTSSLVESQTGNRSSTNSNPFTSSQDAEETTKMPVFGQQNPALAPPLLNGKEAKDGKDTQKRKKPKNNMVKTNSSFVSRVQPVDGLTKKLNEHNPNGTFIFANVGRSFQWLDLSAPGKSKSEPLTKILFSKAHALCHDVNQMTKSSSHIDVIMGFSTGDIIWYEPMTQKYARINKNGIINAYPVLDIKWMPGSENLFLAAHSDGTLVVYDKEKEDAAFDESLAQPMRMDSNRPVLQVWKSVQSQDQKTNPVAYWKVCNQKINEFAFSPDDMHLAIAAADGKLRIIDFHKEQLLDVYCSYFGEFTCVCWSPDGNYILTGSQDDLISIWSLAERRLVARFQGHRSWVKAVAFDPWRSDDRNYRFGSVGDDCCLLLWDFNVGMLHAPRAASVRQRASISSHSAALRSQPDNMNARLRSDSNLTTGSLDEDDSIVHPTVPKSKTPFLRPLMAKRVDDHPLCWLGFQEDCIMTSCKKGHVRIWNRPEEQNNTNAD